MRKRSLIILGIIIAGLLMTYWLWPKEGTKPKSNTDIINLFIDFKIPGKSKTSVLLHQGDISVKPTYYKSSNIQELSPTFALASEGLHHFDTSNGELFSYLYLIKGGEYKITLEPNKSTFKGTDQKVNQFLVSYQQHVDELTRTYLPSISSIKKASPITFMQQLEQMDIEHNKLIQKSSFLPSEVSAALVENYKSVKKMILLTFLDKKYTNKQAKTALKYVNQSDFNDATLAIKNINYARASAAYYSFKSTTSSKVKQTDIVSFKTYLMESGLTPDFAERLCVERCRQPKFVGQTSSITNNEYYINYTGL